MRLQVLALDYDGTIATNGILEPSVREAILAAREHEISVLLVTGRILADLERLLGDLRLFDAITAENGAVLHFPESGRSLLLASPRERSSTAVILRTRGRRGLGQSGAQERRRRSLTR